MIFSDSKKNNEYFSRGYTVLPLLNESQVDELLKIFNQNYSLEKFPSVYNTIVNASEREISFINDSINTIIYPSLTKVIFDFKIVASAFMIKKPEADSYLNFHIDPTMTYKHLNNVALWIPLCDIDETNGLFYLEPYTKYMIDYYTPSMPSPFFGYEELIRQNSICFKFKKGEALFFDNRILHSTGKNESGTTRVAIVTKLLDAGAPLATPYYEAEKSINRQVSLFEHRRNIFLTGEFRNSTPPPDSVYIEYLDHLPMRYSQEEYLARRNFYYNQFKDTLYA
ncbi:MAG: phytanoyl-CoA dioxygenase family protein [Candidatus Calescibacterium sp.]|nr:phytanoyl-CoA dioxygenase family protein [Candidatus Calescibacterium sp.]